MSGQRSTLSFAELNAVNVARCEAPDGFRHALKSWSPSDWGVAFGGEAGEVLDAIKKRNRVIDGIGQPGDPVDADAALNEIADELADVVIYADLLATRLGIDLGAAVAAKFNRTSAKIGSPARLPTGVA